jgi:hypothetical protein
VAEAIEQCAVACGLRVRHGQQLVAVEDRVGAGGKAQRLQRFVHLLAPGRQPHFVVGIVMRATAMVRTNSNGSIGSASASGVPVTSTRLLIGTDSG